MKKKYMCNTNIVYFIVLVIIAGIASCQKQLPDNFDGYVINGGSQSQTIVDPQLTLDASRLEFSSGSGSKTFLVTSNTSWTVSSNEAWCSVIPTSRKNSSSVTVNVAANRSTSSRSATITVETSSITKTLEVTQEGATSSSSQARTFTVGGVEFKMIAVEGGTFTMGATSEQGSDAFEDEYPTHSVTLSSYSIGETEVTQALWETVMGSISSHLDSDGIRGNNRPVAYVSWDDCQDFITKLNAITGESFRLPTEAEWEFAARGGNLSRGYKYAGSNSIDDVAWTNISYSPVHDVATKQANELGIYDMSGNVEEWCNDWYGHYSSSAQTNPIGPLTGSERVCRGGWQERFCRVSCRQIGIQPAFLSSESGRGLRLALSNETDGFISFDARSIEFNSSKGEKSFTVSSNIPWTISSDEAWCSVSPTSGGGDGSVTITVEENTSTTSRMATIMVESASLTQTFTLTQEGATSSSSQTRTFSVGGVKFKMIAVDSGTFMMGATSEQGSDADVDEYPTHSVTLSSYSIGETEVTQALWEAVMGSKPFCFSGNNRPVESVYWVDCQKFITKLNVMTGERFRLPTEAEWEFAARGGNKSMGYKYSGSNTIGDVAWYNNNSSHKTHDVATKQPNELGIYDMSGNVLEWCSDWYGDYSSFAQTNPKGPTSGTSRVIRGSSCFNQGGCRISNRYSGQPLSSTSDCGFRLAL